MDEFLAWLRDNGAAFPKIDWPRETSNGRGAVALADIHGYEAMVEIPFQLMMTPLHAMDDPIIGKALTEKRDMLDSDLVLSVFLIHEQLKHEDSFYFPYIRILPPPSTICNWTPNRLAAFQDESLIVKSKLRTTELVRMHDKILDLCREHPTVFSEEVYNFNAFRFAYEVVQSRAFGKRLKWSALVPFADCLNHSNVQTKYDFDILKNGKFRLFPSGSNSYATGAEVFNSYGRRPNYNLLLDYGFAILDNEWDTISISAEMRSSEDEYATKVRLMHGLRMGSAMKYSLSRFGLPLDLMVFYRIIALTRSDMEGDLSDNFIDILGFYNVAIELRAVTLLLASMGRLLSQYPTELDADQRLLSLLSESHANEADLDADSEEGGTDLVALTYRVTQKRILQKTQRKLALVKSVLQSCMDGDESSFTASELVRSIEEISGPPKSTANTAGCSDAALRDYFNTLCGQDSFS